MLYIYLLDHKDVHEIKCYLSKFDAHMRVAACLTRPEVSEGGPAITNLIQGVAREETDIHRQIEVSMDLPL